MAELLFRQGKLSQLFDENGVPQRWEEGSINFTVDEPAIYLDYKADANSPQQRLRIGDIKEFADINAIKAYITENGSRTPTSGLYYAIAENILMKYDKDGTDAKWKQINLTDEERKGITTALNNLSTAVTTAQSTAEGAATAATEAYNNAETRVLKSDFEDFKTDNTGVIGEVRTLAQQGVDDAAKAQETASGAATAATEAANAAAKANENANTRVLKSDFEDFKTSNSAVIKAADDKAVKAQETANKGVTDAAAAQATANNAVTAAAEAAAAAGRADENANIRLPISDFNEFKKIAIVSDGSVAMAADLKLGSHKIINLKAPTADTDAANKKYVDDAVSNFNSNQNANLGELREAAVLRDGTASLTGNWDINYQGASTARTSHKITGLVTPTADSDAVNKQYVDNKFKTADAMQFKGVVESAEDLLNDATSIQAGWTYKVGKEFSFDENKLLPDVFVGDLLIANADASATVVYDVARLGSAGATWSHVSSGYEAKNAAYFNYIVDQGGNKNLYLDDIESGNRGSITFQDNNNVKAVVSAAQSESSVEGAVANINVGFKLEWGTFDN